MAELFGLAVDRNRYMIVVVRFALDGRFASDHL